MSNSKIRLKKSSVIGKVPSVGDLDHGELAINFADGIIYYKNSSNQISSFIDSDLIVSAIESRISGFLDSSETVSLIQNNSIDSSGVLTLIDSDYVISRFDASDVSYDNTETDFVATNVQSAIDELDDRKLDISSLASNVTYYSTTDSSDVEGYFRLVTSTLDSDFDDTPVNVPTGVIDSDNIFIASLVSDSATIVGETGFINVSTVGSVRRSSGFGSADFYYEIYKRDSSGSEELLTTSNTTREVNVDTYEQFSASALLPNTLFTEKDRVVLKYYGNRTTGFGSPTFEFQFEGSGNSPVRTLFPVPVDVVPLTNNAEDILVDTTNFDGVLGGADDDIQSALETIDDVTTTDIPEGNNLYYTTERVDSDVLLLVDSDYVAARVPSSTTTTSYEEYYYTADSGQTVFTGLDDDSSGALSYTPSLINVYLNGILLDSDEDYSASDGSTVTLVNPTEPSDVLQVLSFTSDLQVAEYDYTASAAQTTITGLDNNSRALAYKPEYVEVYVNGVLLDPKLDYVATTGVSIDLNEPLALNDFVQVFALTQFKDEDPETPYRDFYFSVDSSDPSTLSGLDSDGELLQYDVGAIKVFNNGVLMNPQTDYNAIDGVSVNFTTALDSSDKVQIQSFERPDERPSFEEVVVSSGVLVGGTNDSYRIDEYRNTTFNPVVEGETSSGTATYTTQVGQFVRIGNSVNFTLQVEWSNHTGTGNLLIGGLPFTSLDRGSLDYVFPVSTDGTITYTNYDNLISKMSSNSNQITLHTEDGAGNTGQLSVPSSGKVLISGQYFIE